MRRILLAALFSLGLTGSVQIAGAQSKTVGGLPVESVTVLAIKPSSDKIKDFVQERVAPSHALNRMARWTLGVCPLTIGLGDKYASYISQRIRDAARAVGAPVNSDPGCRPNIEVVFTTTPQALMDNIRRSDPVYLGFSYTSSEADALAKVTHPIQAWYTIMSQGAYEHRRLGFGGRTLDMGRCLASGSVSFHLDSVHEISLPCLTVAGGSGSRAKDDLVSAFYNVLILAEPAKLNDYEIGSLADYITMMALSQPSLDACPELPSVSNMLAAGCASSTTSRITDGDLAYLHALYRMPGGEFIAAQQDFIRDEMFKTLVADKGGAN
jgi:hypothetical protein